MNKWLRLTLYVLGFGGFAALVYWASIDNDSFVIRKNNNRLVEIKQSSLSGYENGVKSWRIQADYIWAGRSKYLFQADEVHSGELYNADGTIAVDTISARRIRVNTKAKTLTAFKNVSARFLKKEEENEGKKFVQISAQELRFFSNANRAYISGDVRLTQGTTKIYPRETVEIDTQDNKAYVFSGLHLVSNELAVSANQLVIAIDDNRTVLEGGVMMKRLASPTDNPNIDEREKKLRKEPTFLMCDEMQYENDDTVEVAFLKGNIIITQADKVMKGNEGVYDRKNNTYDLQGNVVLQTKRLDWILTKDPSKFKNKEVGNAMVTPVKINCESLHFDNEKKVVECDGDVILTQDDKTVKAKRMVFDDKAGKIYAKGNVEVIKKTKEKFYCETLTIDIHSENVDAHENVMSEFIIQKKKPFDSKK